MTYPLSLKHESEASAVSTGYPAYLRVWILSLEYDILLIEAFRGFK